MVSLLAIYQTPPDPDEFLAHYTEVHAPLAQAMPGLQGLSWGKVESLSGKQDVFLVATMNFADRQALDQALASPEGRAAGRDLNGFAKGIVELKVVEWQS
ncbi:MAG: EthD family reductase [Sulfobacillus benefaciens]|uniref:EthD family reductase n=1 Tax=Sulfobacillus benefaciens TaxID=453960 RepID=A0A2T2XKE3_9FIRM|nr:MAG: EthD family reductase [Sulfobacillus benefaciens]